jgi:hypothetical protein
LALTNPQKLPTLLIHILDPSYAAARLQGYTYHDYDVDDSQQKLAEVPQAIHTGETHAYHWLSRPPVDNGIAIAENGSARITLRVNLQSGRI